MAAVEMPESLLFSTDYLSFPEDPSSTDEVFIYFCDCSIACQRTMRRKTMGTSHPSPTLLSRALPSIIKKRFILRFLRSWTILGRGMHHLAGMHTLECLHLCNYVNQWCGLICILCPALVTDAFGATQGNCFCQLTAQGSLAGSLPKTNSCWQHKQPTPGSASRTLSFCKLTIFMPQLFGSLSEALGQSRESMELVNP